MESLRPARPTLHPREPAGWLVESELGAEGRMVKSLTAFLTNRECPWRCVYCDLWKFALADSVAPGDVPAQLRRILLEHAQRECGGEQVKLYNAGSFFDARAIPESDDATIQGLIRDFGRVIVESHPALVGARCWRFRDGLAAASGGQSVLEVAMGLETVNPKVLPQLNKRVTLETFARAAAALHRQGVALRTFVLVRPPFEEPAEAITWAIRSVDFAMEQGSTAVALIPVRGGNGALEALAARGQFHPPALIDLELAMDGAISVARGRGRVFADVWDLARFADCPRCFDARRERLERMNRTQAVEPRVVCAECGGGGNGPIPRQTCE
ncbi:MAG: hypothetical protein JNK85_27455 [Verrucomicrobiales bacterium]|nr:hypothetical protein [Verrucomicrobiales bacterium]